MFNIPSECDQKDIQTTKQVTWDRYGKKGANKGDFLCLKPLSLNTNIKLSNNKTKAILLSRSKRPIARLVLSLLLLSLKYEKWENLDWTKKSLLLKIPTDPRYCERLTSISKRERPSRLLSRCKIYNRQY